MTRGPGLRKTDMHKIESIAYWLRNGQIQCGEAQDFFSFFDGERHVISIVGGGGKSTLLAYLAACFAARGMRTAVMTTTHMAIPAHLCMDMEDCLGRWQEGEYAAIGIPLESGKLGSPDDALLTAVLAQADAVIVEADGSRRLACKAPAAHEPVILPESDIVIGVMGVEVLGHPVGAVCHRPEHVCALLGCGRDHRLTAQDMAEIFVSDKGTRKNVGARDFYAVINKCDNAQRIADGSRILKALAGRGQNAAVLTSFKTCND